ncbi:MAG: hypothetical protein JJU00_18840 [Opitutales bacterium]|nr:hypothetical protein [Opitutales bacterium]
MKTYPVSFLGLLLMAVPVFAQPTDNPVTASGIDLGGYDGTWTDGMVDWTNVLTTAASPGGADVTALVQTEIFDLSEAGGGVLYFPAGTYHFSDDLFLADGVVLRGATPAASNAVGSYTGDPVRVYNPTYAPATRFQFPFYQHSIFNNMRPGDADSIRDQFFKRIEVGKRGFDENENEIILPDATHASNLGIVNIDIDSAFISINDRGADQTWGTSIPKNAITAQNILVFGNRINNAFVPEPGIPTANQNAWQIWPTRTRAKIDAVTAGNTLICNNAVMDKHYRYHVLGDDSVNVMDIRAIGDSAAQLEESYLNNNGERILAGGSGLDWFDPDTGFAHDWIFPSDGYSIRLNHVLNYTTAHAAPQEPSKHREGMGLINNFTFGTTRVGIMGAGNGLVLHNNVRVDFLPSQTKWEFINEQGTARITNNSATQENRGIDVTGGHDVRITSNYVQVRRGTFASGYLTIDGEGLLLQESSSTHHPTNWLIKDNTLHSYIGIYRVIYSNGVEFVNNRVYGNGVQLDGSRNGYMGRTGGTYPVIFRDNVANAVFSRYNIKPRNYVMIDLGGNSPTAQNREEGNAGVTPEMALETDAVPGLEILYPTRAGMAGVTPGSVMTLRVRVTRDPADEVPVLGLKAYDGISGYPANNSTGEIVYWDVKRTDSFTVDTGTGFIGSPSHGLAQGNRVRLSAEGGDLPEGLNAETNYFVRQPTADSFRVSTTNNNNNLVNFTDGGSGTLMWVRPNVPVEIDLQLVDPDPVTGGIGGGIYEGTWTVPEEFDRRGLLMAEVRLEPQPTPFLNNAGNAIGPWSERNWAFMEVGEAGPPVLTAPTGVQIRIEGNDVVLEFATLAGLRYQLMKAATGLGHWNEVDRAVVTGDGSAMTLTDANAAPARGDQVHYVIEVSAPSP